MPPKPAVSRAELEVLTYIQDHYPVTVREVAEHFVTHHGKAKTTILTLMERLRQKGHLTREERDGFFHYSPAVPKAETQRMMVHEFIQTALGGSLSPFMAYLSGKSKVSEQELEELKRLVAELEAHEADETRK
ncbi:MAG: BlaI/MecI/CopY family transcriptional regulator [Armatimonas sp.]